VSIRYTPDEAWAFVEGAHTGILTTLRSDGFPVTLPVWFAVLERTVCFSTPPGTKKLARIRRDPRASFLVESGQAWTELAAVHLSGKVSVVTDEGTKSAVNDLMEAKYAAYRVPAERMPTRTQQVYSERVVLQLVPDGRVLSWDNSRIPLRS
jgi:PPOX class probable F420-dependent enzyme